MSTLTAFYDLAIGPVSFDFVPFMVKARMEQERTGSEQLHVVIVPFLNGIGGMFRDKLSLYDEPEMRWRLWNILIPAAQLFRASVTLATSWDQARKLYEDRALTWPPDWDGQSLKNRRHLVGDIITWAKDGRKVPSPEASPQARRKVREWYAQRTMGRKNALVVTITHRKTYLPERNTNRADWLRPKWHINGYGYQIVELQDTGEALSSGSGYGELNLDLRMACYEEAALNLQANNGAASLCWFGQTPYRMFGAGVPAGEWDGLFVKQGLPLGETWPWARNQQKLVYGPTTSDQIINEFEEWRKSAGAMS